MRQIIRPGHPVDFVTPDEIVKLIPAARQQTLIRATESVVLDAIGGGFVAVYKVPIGYDFAIRRVSVNLSTASDPSTGNVPLNVAGRVLAYQRSGTLIEYGAPMSPNAAPQVPGVQTWGEQQGPYLQNGEVFEVRAVGLTAGAGLSVAIQGILVRPAENENA